MTDAALDFSTTPPTLVVLSQLPSETRLPYDAGDERYRCLDCSEVLILRQRQHSRRFTPNFGHYGGAECSAPLTRRAETVEHLAAKTLLAQWLRSLRIPARIEPGVYVGSDGAQVFRPDVSAWPDEQASVGIEYQRSPLAIGDVARREAAYRGYAGEDRLHLWVFSTSEQAPHYASNGTVRVAGHDGRHRTHRKVVPTRDQLDLAAAGATVCWLDLAGGWLYVPYSGTDFVLPPRADELWSGHGESSGREWRAGYPQLDPAAAWWALAPTPLRMCGISTDRSRLLVPAVDRAVRAVLDEEPARESRRRAAARRRRQEALLILSNAIELQKRARAGLGERATGLTAELEQLTAAAAHEHAAALAAGEEQASREKSRQLDKVSADLAGQARRNALSLALSGRRRSGILAAQQRARHDAEDAARAANAAAAQVAASRKAAGQSHSSGARGRARETLASLETQWERRWGEAVAQDVADAQRQVESAAAPLGGRSI